MAPGFMRPVIIYQPMKALRFFAAWPLLAAGLWAAAPAVNDTVLPEGIFPQLDAILKQAVQQSPVMLNRAIDLEMAENNRIAARAALLPSVGGYFNIQRQKDTTDFVYKIPALNSKTAYWTTQTPYALSLSQPLFAWGERRNIAKIGEISQSIAQGNYRDGYRLLAQILRTQYMRLIVLKISVERAAFFLEFSKNQLDLEEARLAKKIISEMQIFPVRLRAEQAQIASEQAAFSYEMAKASFARLAGLPIMDDAAIPNALPVIPYIPASFDQLLAGYLAQKDPPTAEAVTARKQLEIVKLNYANAKTRLRPKINFNTGVQQNVQSNLYGTIDTYQLQSLYAGVGVNWSIFDGFASGAYQRNSLAQRRQQERDYKVMTERLYQQAQTEVKQINFAARTTAISDRGLVATEGALRSKQEDFARGDVAEADVSYARIGLYDAQINAYNNRIDFLGRVGDFLGTIVEDPVLANLSDK
jgi:outer membrane protein TolC